MFSNDILIFVLKMVDEEYLQVVDVELMMVFVLNKNDYDENFSMYVHHEN